MKCRTLLNLMVNFSRRFLNACMNAMLKHRLLVGAIFVLHIPHATLADVSASEGLVDAARNQIGETTIYDPSYIRLNFPNGDFDRRRGVCSDVVVRALRDWGDIDLQALVNADMRANFDTYPKIWSLTKPDPNIDHRRVPNLRRYFERMGFEVPATNDAADYHPGDLVTWLLPRNRPHIGIVSEERTLNGRPLIIHNVGRGTVEEDILFSFKITGHYRLNSSKLIH